jgi:hypothetical protein
MSQQPVKIITQNTLRGVVIAGELVQRRRASVHMLRRPAPAWAVGDDVLAVARSFGAVRVRILDTDSGAEYVTDMTTLDAHGRRIDHGHGAQTALDLRYWQKQGGGMPDAPRAERVPQLALFA